MDILNINEYSENTTRSTKSRKGSLSSLLGESNFNNSRLYHEKLSIKKLAKACSRSLWNSNNYNSTQPKTTTEADQQCDSPKFETFSLIQNMTRRHRNKTRENNGNSDPNIWKNYFETGQNDTKNITKIEIDEPSKPIDITNNLVKKKTEHQPQLTENNAHSQVLIKNDNLVNMMDSFNIGNAGQNETEFIEETGKRIIQLKNFHSFAGAKSIISQVSGGPLEKLVIHNYSNEQQMMHATLELWFLKSSDALNFLEYSYSGLFLVNGCHVNAYWAPQSKIGTAYHSEPDKFVAEEMVVNGASRCLILKKYVFKKASHKKTYPSPLKNFSDDLILEDISNDFSRFGSILEITPVISKKLCLAIHFYDTVSAINAKKEFDGKTTEIYEKYKDWTLWYGKDLCDTPCLNV